MCECVDLFQRKTAARSECYCEGRIEMSAGDVTERVNKNHDGESPNDGDPWMSHGFVVLGVHSHRCTTSKYQEVGSQNLSHQLNTEQL